MRTKHFSHLVSERVLSLRSGTWRFLIELSARKLCVVSDFVSATDLYLEFSYIMSAEISSGDHVAEISNGAATVNGTQEMNGVSNGYIDKHKSSSKDKHRDQKHSSSKHSSSSNREKHSSSGKEKERSSSHKSSRDKDRDKERSDKVRTEKDRSEKDRSDKERSNKDRSDKERSEKERSDKDRSNKDRSDKDRHRSKDHKSSRDKDRDKDKKDGSNSEKDKDRKHKHSSKDKEKEVREKEKKEDGSKSSSNRDKDKERSRDKDREKDRKDRKDKHKSSSSGHKSSRDKVKSESRSPEKKIKTEHGVSVKIEDCVKEEIKVEPDIYEDKPDVNTSQSSCDYSLSQFKEDESLYKTEVKEEQDDVKMEEDEDSEEDIPLSKKLLKHKIVSDSEDDVPILKRTKEQKVEKKSKKTKKRKVESEDDFEEEEEVKPKKKKTSKSVKNEVVSPSKQNTTSPTKRKKKEEEPEEVWKWWEEEKKDDGTKWKFLEHKGPLFAPPYERLPSNVKFYYDGKEFQLSEAPEEIACFYAKMLEHDFTSKKVFNENFFKDWRKSMNEKERSVIKDLTKCDFRKMNAYFTALSEKNKQKTKEEKLAIKQKNEEMIKEYGFCTIDGHKEKIGNFRIEPPGLFRGRGEHPKMGMVKKRVVPEQIMINCSKDSVYPKAPQGHKWKEIRHDNTVTWLVSWTENVQNQVKYVMLNPSSKLKGEKDWQKYETARKLHKCIDKIRQTYQSELKAKEMKIRQRAVALYFIDKLALRAGNEKDEDQADTVGCCSLRVEHIQLFKQKDGKEYVVVFDFLGKDSIRYYNEVPVEKRVFKNLELFKENKKDGDDLFDRLNTMVMNDHLRDLMEGLSAKVFRTYNASITLQKQLEELTDPDSTLQEKLLSYNRANRAVAVLCNHQRAIPKSHDKSMNNLRDKMNQKRELIEETEAEVRELAKAAKRGSVRERTMHEKKKNALDKLKEQLKKMEVQETDRDENKTIALGTSKLNYLDPRISVAWCKKFGVPIDKIYNKTQRDKFRWAVDMATEDYVF